MPLTGSGQISLNDIRVEFQSLPTSISLNECYRGGLLVANTPSNQNIPTSGQISLSNFYGARKYLGSLYSIISAYDGVTSFFGGTSMIVDDVGQAHIWGTLGPGNGDFVLVRTNSSYVYLTQRVIGGTGIEEGTGISATSNGDYYVCGNTTSPSTTGGTYNIFIAKYNTNLSLLWQKHLGTSTTSDRAYDIYTTSAGVSYICGSTNQATTADAMFIVIYGTTGIISTQVALVSSGIALQARGITADSNTNIYVCGQRASDSAADLVVAKYNSSLTLQWQRQISRGTSSVYPRAIASDGTNVYVCGTYNFDVFIASYDTNGTLRWQRSLGSSTNIEEYGTDIAYDSTTGHIFICGSTDVGTSAQLLVARYDTSGTLQWQRTIGITTLFERGFSIFVRSNFVYVSGKQTSASGRDDIFAIKIPTSGADTVTFSGFSYAASSLISSTPTLTSTNPGFTPNTRTLTDAVSSLPENSTASISSTVTIF